MSLHDQASHLFAPLVQQQAGRFSLVTPVREIALDLSGGQVLGVDGIPELLTDLTELQGLKLSGNLAQDLNLALTQGVSYETAAHTAADNLGRVLVRLMGHPHATTTFQPAPPSPGAWPLPKSLVHIVRDALRAERSPEDLAQHYGGRMDHRVERTPIQSQPFALDPVALRTLGSARSGQTLGELLLHSGRGVPARTRQAWLAIDLLLHLGLLALRSPDEAPAPQPTPEAAPPVDVEEGPPPKKPRLKKKRRRRKKRPEVAADGEAPPRRKRRRPPKDGEDRPRRRRRKKKPELKPEPKPEPLQEYDDLDLSALDEDAAPVVTPDLDAPVHVVDAPARRTPEQELWYGVDDLTPDDEDEEDPFGLFSSTPDDSVIEPDPLDLTGEFIWADDQHTVESWATRVAEKTVAIPEVSLAELKHLPTRFRTMNPLEVLGLEPGDTVSPATVRESYEQRFAQFDPDAWQASGDDARSWAAQARAYVSAAYRKVQTAEGVEKYAARWREEQDTAPNRLDEDVADEDSLDEDTLDEDTLDEDSLDEDSLDDDSEVWEDEETEDTIDTDGDTDVVEFDP